LKKDLDENMKKRLIVPNTQNIGMVDTIFEELVNDKSNVKVAFPLDHMQSYMTNKIKKGEQDRYIIPINLLVLVLLRTIKLRLF
jgi:hypothetical protein